MNEAYNYAVVIRGLDPIPLRTTAKGAKLLMQSLENLLLEAVDSGTPFKNKLVTLTALLPRPKIKAAIAAKKSSKPLAKKKK